MLKTSFRSENSCFSGLGSVLFVVWAFVGRCYFASFRWNLWWCCEFFFIGLRSFIRTIVVAFFLLYQAGCYVMRITSWLNAAIDDQDVIECFWFPMTQRKATSTSRNTCICGRNCLSYSIGRHSIQWCVQQFLQKFLQKIFWECLLGFFQGFLEGLHQELIQRFLNNFHQKILQKSL